MIYELDRDRRGYQESSRAALEAAIADSGYQYGWSKAEADSIVRYYRSLRGGED